MGRFGDVLAALLRCGRLEAAALVFDLRVQASVPPQMVRAAKGVAVALFRGIGVTVGWTNDDPPCAALIRNRLVDRGNR